MIDPLNCPCCAGLSVCSNAGLCDKDGNPLWWVECLECGVYTSGHNTRDEAINVWNRRSGIVRCKDCWRRDANECAMWYECDECHGQTSWDYDEGFCSYGEQKGDPKHCRGCIYDDSDQWLDNPCSCPVPCVNHDQRTERIK